MKATDFIYYVVEDLLSEMKGVTHRAMFGGYGIYKSDVMFAIIVDDQLYFKTDDTNRKDFKRSGSCPFIYQSRGRSVTMSYWEVPAKVMDDRNEITEWAERSWKINSKTKRKEAR